MRDLESNPASRIVWNSVKPMLMGQILYAPDSPAVRQIIRHVSSIGHLVVTVLNVFLIISFIHFISDLQSLPAISLQVYVCAAYPCLSTLWSTQAH